MKTQFVCSLAAIGLLGTIPPTLAANRTDGTVALFKAYDADHDGSLDLAEVKKAAEAKFDRLEKDKDGTLDRKEIAGLGISMKAGDPDKDGTLDKAEYMVIVEQRFRAADPDKDGTLSYAELKSKAGRKLLLLLK